MAQLPYIGLYKPCINLPFGDCAMYFGHGVYWCFLVAIMFLSLISMAVWQQNSAILIPHY